MSSDPPASVVREHGAGVRLHLGSVAHGDGPSLQEAADDLVRRVLVDRQGIADEWIRGFDWRLRATWRR